MDEIHIDIIIGNSKISYGIPEDKLDAIMKVLSEWQEGAESLVIDKPAKKYQQNSEKWRQKSKKSLIY